jgi:non-homologous end joining protein Ku
MIDRGCRQRATVVPFSHRVRGAEDLDIPDLREGYTEVLKQAIQQKVKGKEITVDERPVKTAKVVNLVDALPASLQNDERRTGRLR